MAVLDLKCPETLLRDWQAGDLKARDNLFTRLYNELSAISGNILKGEGNISLSTSDLVNEAAVRLINTDNLHLNDRAHFLALSARTMRRVLIDHARKKASNKREHHRVTLVTHLMGNEPSIQMLETALTRLKATSPKRAKIVEMRYYGGMTLDDVAAVMECSVSTIRREWRVARVCLLDMMREQIN